METKTFRHDFKDRLIPSIEQLSEDGKRYYMTPDKKKYPSVTTMLGYFSAKDIVAWRKRVGADEANKISRQATTRGTKFHKICENYLLNQPLKFATPLEQQLFINTQRHLDEIDDINLIETRMYSHHLRLAGTADCIGYYNGKLSVIDFKTSGRTKKKEYIEDYFMQCSAYAIMFEELLQIPVPQSVVIIAVEGEESQVFVEKRDTWARKLLTQRDKYEKANRNSSASIIV